MHVTGEKSYNLILIHHKHTHDSLFGRKKSLTRDCITYIRRLFPLHRIGCSAILPIVCRTIDRSTDGWMDEEANKNKKKLSTLT